MEKFQSVVDDMINNTMGAEPCTISTPTVTEYNMETGEEETQYETINIKCALIPTNKDD